MKSENEFVRTEIGIIPNDWETVCLGDNCAKIGSGFTPRGAEKVYKESGVVLIRSQNVYNNSFSKGGLVYLDESTAREMDNVTVEKDDVLLNITGDSVARCCTVPEEILPARVNQHVSIIRTKKERLDPTFLRYYLTSPRMQAFMLSLAESGGTRNALTKGMIERFVVPKPRIEEQISIARIPSALDSRITLNQQMNRTLEAIAKAIFKHWFADLEFPNTEGKPYKSSGGEMIYDEDLEREIPKGWKVGKTNEIATQVKEQVSPSEQAEEIYNHYSIEAYDSGMKPTLQQGSEILSNKFIVRDNTVLVSKLNPRIQRIWPVISAARNSVCSTEFLVFEPRKNSFCYFYHLMLSEIWKDLIRMARGTSSSHQRISSSDILDYPILIPPQEILESFEHITFSNVDAREQNVAQQLTMQEIRDSLVPRLVSGKIGVPIEAG